MTLRVWHLWALLAAAVVLSTLVQLPRTLDFTFYAFEDLGGSSKLAQLVSQGLRPTLDFYYPYGLLPLLFSRLWFGLFGSSPWVYLAATLACNLLLAWGLARFVVGLGAGPWAVVFLLATLDFVARPMYLNLTHALEAALLGNALAEHARGRRPIALVLVTICAFVKPSMAYVYGGCLLALMAGDLLRHRVPPEGWRRALGPAVVTALFLTILLAASFGVGPLLDVQLPIKGAASYRYVNYGFFQGAGRNFWNPEQVGPAYYLATPAGLWIVGTLVLIAGGAALLWKRSREDGRWTAEVALSALLMHVAFVCLFFGAAWDWIAYFFVLALGIVAAAHRLRWGTPALAVLTGLALPAHWSSARDLRSAWTTSAPSTATGGLWATPRQRAEWTHVLQLTRGRRAMLVSLSGAAEVQFPELAGTGSFYVHGALVEPLMPPRELARITSRLRAAPMVVAMRGSPADVAAIPRFRRAMADCRLAWRGEQFDVYRCG